MAKRIPRIGEILINKGWLTWDQLDEGLRTQHQIRIQAGTVTPKKDLKSGRETFLNIGEILIQQGWIKPDDLAAALTQQQETGEILGSILLKKAYATEKNLQHALAIQHGMSFVELEKIAIPDEILKLIPKHLAYEHHFIPLIKKGNMILLAISNPKDINAEASVKQLFPEYDILTALMMPSDLTKALQKYYGPG